MRHRRIALAALTLALAGPAFAEPTVINSAAAFPEGPWVENGTLYYVQYGNSTVSVWDGTAVSTLWQGEGCGPSAIAPLGDDFVLTCYDNGTITRIGRGSDIATYSGPIRPAHRCKAPMISRQTARVGFISPPRGRGKPDLSSARSIT